MKTNYLKRYIISSHILVWMLIIFVAGSASLVFHAPPVIMWVIRNLIAWSPTYLILIGWKYFRPDETRTAFIKRCFSEKVKPFLLLFSFTLTFGISVLALFLFSIMTGKPMLFLHQSRNDIIATQYLSLTNFRTDRRRIGMAWFYARRIQQKVWFS